MYFDVMPGSIDGLARWRGITSNDWDGDGIMNSEETSSSQWLWDTDGDGLGDPFELEIGMDPSEFDTDGDGLDDWYEFIWGLDWSDDSPGGKLTGCTPGLYQPVPKLHQYGAGGISGVIPESS